MMGEMNYFLGLQVRQMNHGTFLHQTKYCKEILKKFYMDKRKEAATLMATNCYLSMDEKGKLIDQTKYRGIIGSLLYLTASRPNIMFSIFMCAHYQSCPKESHFSTIKRVMKYLRGTLDVGLWYPKGVEISLRGYFDFDFGECKLDKKSTSDICNLLGRHGLVSWNSMKQACVALSMSEAKYIVAWSYCAQILWPKQQLSDFRLNLEHISLR